MDPLGTVIPWLAASGSLGLLGVTLLERLVPILPSKALLVAIGIAVADGHWPLHTALLMSTAGSLLGCLSFYVLGWALGEARGVENARSMALSPNGTLFVGSRSAGNVYAILDRNSDDTADEVITVARGLHEPNGVVFRDGALYVAEVHRVLRFDHIESRLKNPPAPVVVSDQFPTDGQHGWKFIRFGPDDLRYVPVGAPCDICEPQP